MIRRCWIAGACLALLPLSSQAIVLLMVEGVPGPATLPGYTGWFDVESVSWGLDRSNAAAPHSLTVSLVLTANLATVAQASANGAVFKKIAIDQVLFLENAPKLVARAVCEEAVVREYAQAADSDDRFMVELDIRCAKLTWENFDYTAQGAVLRNAKGSWNFKSNTP